MHKTIKRYLLSLPILAGLVGLSFILQDSTSAAQPDVVPSDNYTLQHHPDQVSRMEEEADLDMEEMPQVLTSSAADQKEEQKEESLNESAIANMWQIRNFAHERAVNSVHWSHDDRFLASVSDDKHLRIWDAKTGRQVQICTGHDKTVWSVRWSHDDRFLASASDDQSVRVWDSKTGGQIQICTGEQDEVNSVSWSHDDRFLASAGDDKRVRIWDAKTGEQVQTCTGHDKAVWSVSWSHDDRYLASASEDKRVRVWDAKTGEQVQICRGHPNSVLSVSWSHDDRFLASASYDKRVRIWDAKSGKQVQVCTGHNKTVWSVSWSPDDRFVASASGDKSVRIWDAKTGAQVQMYTGHEYGVNSVSWSHDGLFIASAGDDKHVRVWACKLPRDLSATNLTDANLTGHHFTATNFTGTQLEGAILTNTTCDYQQCFADNVASNQLSGGKWYLSHLPKDLKSIAEVYPLLSEDSHKAELLQIASGLAYLPYWAYKELYIKVYYWSCKLLILKKKLGSGLGAQLVCTLGHHQYGLNYEANEYCWQTDYPQHQVEEAKEAPHDDFAQYLTTFQEGLKQYNCTSKCKYGYDWYKDNIEKNIQGLQKTYAKLTAEKLRKEAVDIGFQLSKIYQYQHLLLLFRYLFLQDRLIGLKISAGVEAGNEVHYNDTHPFSRRYAGVGEKNEAHYNHHVVLAIEWVSWRRGSK